MGSRAGLTQGQGPFLQTVGGEIISDWRIENGRFKLSVTVPPGTTATVFVPGEGPVRTQAPQSSDRTGNRTFEVGSGTHAFETLLQPNR